MIDALALVDVTPAGHSALTLIASWLLTVTHITIVMALWIGTWRTLRRIGPMNIGQEG